MKKHEHEEISDWWGEWGQPGEVFYVSRMRDKHRENRQMRKTDRQRGCCEQPCRRCLYSAFHSRNSFKAFTPQIFTDGSQFVNYCGVWILDGFIYMIMKLPVLDVNNSSLFSFSVPSGWCGAQALFECLLAAFVCSPATVDLDMQWKPFE